MATDTNRTYHVIGMTCNHCVRSVSEEVGALFGVTVTDVDLESARLTVTGSGFTDEAVMRAVEAAGYQVAP